MARPEFRIRNVEAPTVLRMTRKRSSGEREARLARIRGAIQALIVKHGTQAAVAKLVHLSTAQLSRTLDPNGNTMPRVDVLQNIATAAGSTLAELIGGVDEPSSMPRELEAAIRFERDRTPAKVLDTYVAEALQPGAPDLDRDEHAALIRSRARRANAKRAT